MEYKPSKILVQENVLNNRLTQKAFKYYKDVEYRVIQPFEPIENVYSSDADEITEGKQILFLSENKGNILKRCPGTKHFICCDYFVINSVENCPFECSYCFLQGYLTNKTIKINTNIESIFEEIELFLENRKNYLNRLGTGELSDSLVIDNVFGFSELLIDFIKGRERTFLELKTKSNNIDVLPTNNIPNNIIISWSLNPQSIIDTDEIYTASLSERLRAAKTCQDNGYILSFHFDPIIFSNNFEELYGEVIDLLFSTIDEKRIAYISLGGLRFVPYFREIHSERFPSSKILQGEFVLCPDGKMRYFKKIRETIYNFMINRIRKHSTDILIYFCMEGKYMWKRIFQYTPKNKFSLGNNFTYSLNRCLN